ncbi:unnamed protein product, partial [Lepidochelys olivacea]
CALKYRSSLKQWDLQKNFPDELLGDTIVWMKELLWRRGSIMSLERSQSRLETIRLPVSGTPLILQVCLLSVPLLLPLLGPTLLLSPRSC